MNEFLKRLLEIPVPDAIPARSPVEYDRAYRKMEQLIEDTEDDPGGDEEVDFEALMHSIKNKG